MKKLLKKYLPLWIVLGSLLVATMMISAKPSAKANIQKFVPPVVETLPGCALHQLLRPRATQPQI